MYQWDNIADRAADLAPGEIRAQEGCWCFNLFSARFAWYFCFLSGLESSMGDNLRTFSDKLCECAGIKYVARAADRSNPVCYIVPLIYGKLDLF